MDIDMEDVKGKPPVKSSSRRKLTRQTPLSKESPSRVRRAHTLASSTLREGILHLSYKSSLTFPSQKRDIKCFE